MKSAIRADAAAAMIPDGATLLIGGFMAVGTPHRLIDALVARGARDLTRHRQRHRDARPRHRQADLGRRRRAG